MTLESSHSLKLGGRRRYIRFPAAVNTWVQVGLQDDPTQFRPEHIGLVVNESYRGCAAVMRTHAEIQLGRTCVVECGALEPMKARILRVQPLDCDVVKVAFEYLS